MTEMLLALALLTEPIPREARPAAVRPAVVRLETTTPLLERWPDLELTTTTRPGIPAGNLNQQPFLLPPEAMGLPRTLSVPRWLNVPGGTAWW